MTAFPDPRAFGEHPSDGQTFPMTDECERLAAKLNRECQCVSLDREALRKELLLQEGGGDLFKMIIEDRPYLFAESAVFVAEAYLRNQAETIAAVERVVAMPAYQEAVLAYAPATAQFVPKAHGVFLGYDFHLGASGPQLIEINTNAGGPLLNALLVRAQSACRDQRREPNEGELWNPRACGLDSHSLEQAFLAMFFEEWRAERIQTPLRSVAIVDEKPESQYLFPEFLLFESLFKQNGINAFICDPDELILRDGTLWHQDQPVDLVYNRLTDFGLETEANRSLREAYLTNAAVITPHPRAHALYADKRNLALLTNEAALHEMGVDATTKALLLGGIAHTVRVRREDADALWAARKRLFFKPAAGYGSKAAYRGDKMTRRVFEEILQGDCVAQSLVPPSERLLRVGDELMDLKLDLRNYVYKGCVQMVSARLYQGQTTNFRTPGGGFAPVVIIPCGDSLFAHSK